MSNMYNGDLEFSGDNKKDNIKPPGAPDIKTRWFILIIVILALLMLWISGYD